MATLFYDILLAISLVLMIAYMFSWHKHFDMHITLIFVLVPIVNLGYVLLAHAQAYEAAIVAIKVVYVGGSYLPLIIMLAVFSLCHINLNRWIRLALITFTTVVYVSVLTIGYADVFYKSATLSSIDGVTILVKEYGFMHTVFRIMVIAYFVASMVAVVYCYFKKNQVSRKTIYLLFLTDAIAMLAFFGGRIVTRIELLPIAYDLALAVFLVIVYRLCLYDVTDSAIDSLVQSGETGFASFDFKFNYLGSNKTAKSVFPQFAELTVDKPVASNEFMRETVYTWLQSFAADQSQSEFLYEKDDKTYQINLQYLYSGKRKRGYQLFITDDTKDQRYIKLLNLFNSELQTEVEKKTAHIVEMHDNLIMSMAIMVESRDNSTGGHIRRTSEGVQLLVEAMRKDGANGLTDEFCHDVVKAAPMHDLGKIAVDDAILRKPGRFTPDEFEQMKVHSSEGARIVHEILKGTDDDAFHRIAENVAHYHHERWDGSGYPDGLVGEQIPLEARIMAIADVYDALVSKRVYKEALSFEKAHSIVMDGMGTQFDPGLEQYYLAAKQGLEAYYSGLS